MDQRDRKCGADSNLSQSILVDNYIIFHKFALLNLLSKNRKRLTYSYSMNLDNSRSKGMMFIRLRWLYVRFSTHDIAEV